MKVINRIIVASILTMTLLIYQGVGYAGGPTFDFEFTGELPLANVEENQPPGTEVMRLPATDPDDDSLTFHLLGGGADLSGNKGHGAFTVEGDGNVAVIKTKVVLDYETQNVYGLGVMIEDETGDFGQTLYVNICVTNDPSDDDTNPPNNPPQFVEGESTTRSIAEDAPSGTNIGLPVTATDPDNDPLSYGMWYNDAYGFIELDRDTGQIRVGPNGLDYETQSSYEVRIFANDGKGDSARIDVTIEITDVAELIGQQKIITPPTDPVSIQQRFDPVSGQQKSQTVPQDATNPVPTQQESRIVPRDSPKRPKPESSDLDPSTVAQDRIIFNEIRNASDDTDDWLEIRNISDTDIPLNDWEISIVTRDGEQGNLDIDFVDFPEYTLPAGGILLIVNTDPGETSLVEGYNIEMPDAEQETAPLYLLEETFKLPSTPYLLILRSETDKNGLPEAFEDVMGNYFRYFPYSPYHTQIWPLSRTAQLDFPPPLTVDEAWTRVDIKKRGYIKEAWALSGYENGVGYDPGAVVESSVGTPGYPNSMRVDMGFAGRVIFSELMYATRGGLFSQSQWIELYNNTAMASRPLDLSGWKLVIEVRDSELRHRYTELELETLEIGATETVLLITRDRHHSGHLSEAQVYNFYDHHSNAFSLGLRENAVLSGSGFSLRLYSADGMLVDSAGNLDGKKGIDTPLWELPSGWTEDGARTSLIRVYEADVALEGTASTSWYLASDVDLPLELYYGHKTDVGTPGFCEGGAAPVMLSHFESSRIELGVIVEWVTASESDNAGFNILRGETKSGRFVKVNPVLIPGAGTTAEQKSYSWTDTTAKPNVDYYYQLEDVSFSGHRRRLATVRMRGHLSASGKLLQTWGDLKKQE